MIHFNNKKMQKMANLKEALKNNPEDSFEDYCSLEISKLLKEQGFCSPDSNSLNNYWMENYYSNGEPKLVKGVVNNKTQDIPNLNVIEAPTHYVAIKWIQKTKKLFIETPMYVTNEGLYAFKAVVKDTVNYQVVVIYEEYSYPSIEKAANDALLFTLQNFNF